MTLAWPEFVAAKVTKTTTRELLTMTERKEDNDVNGDIATNRMEAYVIRWRRQ